MPKRIFTHCWPDFDACFSVWLLKAFGGLRNSELCFVPQGSDLSELNPEDIALDLQGGHLDHHSLDGKEMSSAEVVAKHLGILTDPIVSEWLEYVSKIDQGLSKYEELAYPYPTSILFGLNELNLSDSLKVEVMVKVFDGYYQDAIRRRELEDDYKKHVVYFDSFAGPAAALESEHNGGHLIAFSKGKILFVFRNSRGYAAGFHINPSYSIDLQYLCAILKLRDPNGNWILHKSGRLLFSGSQKARQKATTLSLNALISFAKEVK